MYENQFCLFVYYSFTTKYTSSRKLQDQKNRYLIVHYKHLQNFACELVFLEFQSVINSTKIMYV